MQAGSDETSVEPGQNLVRSGKNSKGSQHNGEHQVSGNLEGIRSGGCTGTTKIDRVAD